MRKLILAVMLSVLLLGFSSVSMAYDSILFPYFTSGGGDMTFVQVVNTAAVATPIVGTTQGYLNYIYVYNKGEEEICVHYDDKGRTSKGDILLYEVTGQVAGQLLPGDTTSTSPVLPTSPAWGYLIVEQNSSNFATGLEGTIHGQAFVVNVNTGTAYTYNAMNDPDEYNGDNEWYYNSDDEQLLSFMPETYATTVWYFFPVEDLTTENDTGLAEDTFYTYIEYGWNEWDNAYSGTYDNNESAKSGWKLLPVGCYCPVAEEDPIDNYGYTCHYENYTDPIAQYFFYTPAQLMNSAQYNATKGTGGWAGIYWWDYGYTYKILSTSILGKPMAGMLFEPQYDDTSSYTK